MQDRNLIKSILPKIKTEDTAILPLEQFQNETLRQILKFQNELILQVFQQLLIDYKIDFDSFSSTKKQSKITEIMKENQQIKQFYLGLIAAFFTKEDFEFYVENKKEINKRISSLLIERIASQMI